jgi:glycosyltransferase involved in cell wall biosynthesis
MVSVCMITYGQEKFIGQAIEGILMQETNFEFELIVVNDCSPDNTHNIVNNYIINHTKGNKIQYYRQEKNVGMIPNFVFALNKCKQKYVAICEGDDYWTDSQKLQKQVTFLEANSEFSICFHRVMLLQNNDLVNDWITNPPAGETDIHHLIEFRNYIHTPSVVFRNKKLQIPDAIFLSPVGDYFLYILLTQDGSKIKYLPEVMAVYRYGVGIYSKTGDNEQLWNWYNTQFLIYSCITKKHKKALAAAIAETRLQLESYAVQHITSAKYLSQEIRLTVLLEAARMKIKNELKKRF